MLFRSGVPKLRGYCSWGTKDERILSAELTELVYMFKRTYIVLTLQSTEINNTDY